MAELQIIAPEAERAGIMGAAQAFGGSSLPIGMALTGLLYDALLSFALSPAGSIRVILAAAATLALASAVAALVKGNSEA